MGLTDSGFEPTRASEYQETIKQSFETEVGFAVDWDRDQILGNLRVIMSLMLADTSEAAKAIQDQFDPNNATGLQLDNICALVGVYRKQATFSTVTLTITGTAGLALGIGDLSAEGGGVNDSAIWTLAEDVTVGGGGTVDALFQCTESGATEAGIGTVDSISSPVTGVTSVTNAAAANVGEERETDDELRRRRMEAIQLNGSASLRAIRGAVLALDFVETCAVVENTDSASAVVEGLTLPAHSVAVVVTPNTLTTEQKEDVAETIYGQVAAGIETYGTQTVTTVIGADGYAKTVSFNYATEVPVTVVVATTPETGYVYTDYEADIETAVAALFESLINGDDLTDFDITGSFKDLEGVKRATVTLNGGNTVNATISEILTLNSVTVS